MAPLCSTPLKDPPSLANGLKFVANSVRLQGIANQQAVLRARMSRLFEASTRPALVVGNRRSLPRRAPSSEGHHLSGERALSRCNFLPLGGYTYHQAKLKTDYITWLPVSAFGLSLLRVSFGAGYLGPVLYSYDQASQKRVIISKLSLIPGCCDSRSAWCSSCLYFSSPRPVFRFEFQLNLIR